MKKDFDVIALGGAAFDIPVSPVPRNIMEIGGVNADIRMATGGDALNGAISLSSLGMRTALLTYTGTDEFSDAIVERLKEAGVDTSLVVRDKSFRTTMAYLLIEESGERHILGPGYASVKSGLNRTHVTDEILIRTRHLHYASVNANKFLDGEDVGDVFRRAKALGITTSMDAGFDRDGLWLEKAKYALPYCDIFFPSYSEAVPIAGGRTDVREMAEFFRPYHLQYFGCKLGADGAYLYDYANEREYRQPTLLRGPVVDTTGAGDAFFAGFLTGYLHGWDVDDCLRLASAQSAIIISSIGANVGVRDLSAALDVAKKAGVTIRGAQKEGLYGERETV